MRYRVCLLLLLTVGFSSGLLADGLTSKGRIAAPQAQWLAPTITANWNGGYVGINGDVGPWARDDYSYSLGGQVGYNWHWQGGLVLGFEVDAGKTWLKEQDLGSALEIDWAGSVRARAGFATGSVFLYGTTGVGIQSQISTLAEDETLLRSRDMVYPWVYGAGLELKTLAKGSVKAEWLKFTDREVFEGDARPLERDVFRLGLNYQF